MAYLSLCMKRLTKHYSWLLLLFVYPCFAQTPQIIELKAKLNQTIPDTTRLQLLKQLSAAYTTVDPKLKFYYANATRTFAEKLHDGKTAADAIISMGAAYSIQAKQDSALHYFELGYKASEKAKYDIGMGKSLVNMGFTYDRLDNKKDAIKYYFRALTLFKRINYLKGINQCYTNIGSIYFDLGQHKLAKSYFDECLKSFTANKDEAGIGYALYTVGNCYYAMGQDEKALTYFNKSLAIREKLGDLNGKSLTRRGMGMAYYHLKKYDLAISNLDTALIFMRKLQDKYQEVSVLMPLIDVYLAKKDYDKAEDYALRGLHNSRVMGSPTGVSEMLERLVKVYKNKHNLEKAFGYQSEYVAMQDSVLTSKLLKDVTLTEFGRVRSENAELIKDNRIKSSENTNYLVKIDQYTNIIVLTSCILAFVILVLLILYRRNLEKQATNKQLLLQKEEIATINRELELLNEEVNAQMELTHAQNIELEKLNDVKNKFFSIVSHDLRGPLNTLQTLFSIYREGDIKEKELRMLLTKLEDTILTTGAFLDNLLEWSKNQLEGIIVNPVDFNISECVADNLRLFETKIGLKNLKVSYETNYPLMVHADRNMINMVVRNLLSNSIKFCDEGDEITLSAQIDNERAIIMVKDTGPGISEADRETLFNLEHTLSTGTQGEKGNHLGLILCRDMVVQNNGSIRFETEVGKGTTFWIDLPAGVTESFLKANI
jgi:signal transduction histidine kinase